MGEVRYGMERRQIADRSEKLEAGETGFPSNFSAVL
jgi:hypothetical protein